MNKFLTIIFALLFTTTAFAQNLPAGSVGVVTNNTPNTWQTFNYTFTPTTSGANFIGFAFRQDPAFWTFDNVRITATGSQTNLLTNGGFDTGGAFSVTTNNGPSSMQAPTNWGVWYQNGTYPAAAGTWTNVGGAHGGVWYDGAVGSFDGIYQGVVLQAGTSYTVSFEVSGNNTANAGSIQLGVYGGACATVTLAPDLCTIPASVGFTTLATPAQGAAAGGPPTPPPVTLVSTTNAPSTATSSTTYGNSSVVYNVNDARAIRGQWIAVTRTTIPVTTRPFTITTVTTSHAVETYSDGSTVTINGNPVTTTQNGATVTVGNPTAQTANVSATALKDALSIRKFNPFLVDTLSTKDGVWATPMMGYAKADGSYRSGGVFYGYQKTIENKTAGFAGGFEKSNSHDYLNSESNYDSYSGTAYGMVKNNAVWIKGAVGFNSSEYNTATSLPIFALVNSSKVKAKNYYADLTFYSGKEYRGFRPLIGVTVTKSTISSATELGSPLLSTLPPNTSSIEARPYAGVRYDFNDSVGIETRVTQSKDFNTVGQVRVSVKRNIFKNVYVDVSAGFDKSSNYTAAVGMAGIKINF
jgi:hypothetical protein